MTTSVKTEQIDEVIQVIALTDRVSRHKEEYLAAVPHICADRSRLVTASWKETEGAPLDVRRANLFERVMEGIPIVIKRDEVIVGSQTVYIRGSGPVVDYSAELTFGQFESDHITTSGLVRTAEITDEEKSSLLEDAQYWKGKSAGEAIQGMEHNIFGNTIDDVVAAGITAGFGQKPMGGRFPDHEKVLNEGLNGVIAEAREQLEKLKSSKFVQKEDIARYYFLQAVIIACEGAITFSHRHAGLARDMASMETNPARKKDLERIAETCQWVPANPARSFYEALQSMWLIHLGVNEECPYVTNTPGRMDQYLYPFYMRDLDNGRLTRQEAAELMGCLWVKFAEMEVVKGKGHKGMAQTSQTQNVTIGGVTEDGRDASNEFSYLILEVVRQLKTAVPAVYLRCHDGTPEKLWIKAAEVNADRGDGNPAFLNDNAVVLNFVARGIPMRDARDWVAAGCVYPLVNHRSDDDRNVHINMAKIFELTLNDGIDPRTGKRIGPATGNPRDFLTYDQLYGAFKRQADYFMELFAIDYRLFWQVRNEYYSLPFNAALTDDCMGKGTTRERGGCRYPQLSTTYQDRGLQDIGDSLAAIKKLVFEDKKLTMNELLDVCAHDFEGNGREKIRQMCLSAPKYGNDDDFVDDIHDDLSLWAQRRIYQEKHPLGHSFRTDRGGATYHYGFGKFVGALPNGRKSGTPLVDGSLSPMQGVDVKGPTAVINSASKVNHTEVNCSTLFNMKITPEVMRAKGGTRNFIALVKTYFGRGGYHIQFNLMGSETLRKARNHPSEYRDLLVRVAGFSAYFVDLAQEVQDEIIARTEHTLP